MPHFAHDGQWLQEHQEQLSNLDSIYIYNYNYKYKYIYIYIKIHIIIDIYKLNALPAFMQVPGKGGRGLRPSGWQKSPSSQSGKLVCAGSVLQFSPSFAFWANLVVTRELNEIKALIG